MGKFDGMDPQLVRELLAETERATVELRETEGRVSRILSRAGLPAQTTHRPVQIADAADRMVKDVTARLELLEKRTADRPTTPSPTPDKPQSDAGKPDGDARGEKPDAGKPDGDARGEKPDAGKPDGDARGEKPDGGKPDGDARGEKPDAGPEGDGERGGPCDEDGKAREDRPDVREPGEKPDADARGEKPDAGKPDARPEGDGERDGQCDDGSRGREEQPDPRDREKPDVGEKPDVPELGRPEGERAEDGGQGGECERDAGAEKPDAGERRDGYTQDVLDTERKDHPDDIETTGPRIVEIDGVKVLQVPIDPPSAKELENLLENLDSVRPADMPSVGGCDDTSQDTRPPEGGRAAPDAPEPGETRPPEATQDSPETGQDSSSRDGGDRLVVPPTPLPDDAVTAPVNTVEVTYGGDGSRPDRVHPYREYGLGEEELRALIERAADGSPADGPPGQVEPEGPRPGPDGPPGQVEPEGPRRRDDGRNV